MSDMIHTAKHLLRTARRARLHDTNTRLAFATDQIGRPLVAIREGAEPDPGQSVTLHLSSLALTGPLEPLTEGDKEEQARFEQYHPPLAHAPIWRMRLRKATLDETTLKVEALLSADLPDLARREASAVEHMNEDHADAVALYATHYLGLPEGEWVMQGLDAEGLDMAMGERVARLVFKEPLTSAGDMGPRLVGLAKNARAEIDAKRA